MKKKVVWLVVTGLMMAALLLSSCAPAVVEEEKVAPPKEKEVVVVPEKEVVVPKEEAEMVKVRATKMDGTVVEKMVEKPRYGGVLRVAYTPIVFAFDEALTRTAARAIKFTHENLLTQDWAKGPAGTDELSYIYYPTTPEWSVGGLAESFEVVDMQTIVYHIRKGVHFALDPRSPASRLVAGREMNAYDAEYSINRVVDTPGNYHNISYPRGTVGPPAAITSATATDKWTLVIKYPPGMIGLGHFTYDQYVAILPHEVIEKYGSMNDWKNLVGTGPFLLVDYVDGSSVTYERNPNYWMKDPLHPQNQLPYIDSFKLLIIPDISTRMAAMRTGKIDTMRDVGWEDAAGLKKTNPELKYISGPVAGPVIWARVDKPELPWYDIKVRRALYMAINNQEIMGQFYGGTAVMSAALAPIKELKDVYTPFEELPESVKELLTYHPDKASQLLAEAGYPKGFKIEVITQAVDVDLLSIVKDYWAKVGVNMDIQVKEVAVYTTMLNNHTYKDAIMGSSGSTSPWRLREHMPGQLYNRAVSNDPRIGAAGVAISGDAWFKPDERNRLMKEISVYILEQGYGIHLPAATKNTFWQPWVKAYNGEYGIGFGTWDTYVPYIWLDQDLRETMTGRR